MLNEDDDSEIEATYHGAGVDEKRVEEPAQQGQGVVLVNAMLLKLAPQIVPGRDPGRQPERGPEDL